MSKHWGRYVDEGRYRRCLTCGRITGGYFGAKAKPLIRNGRKP